jgi:hypothetical protein
MRGHADGQPLTAGGTCLQGGLRNGLQPGIATCHHQLLLGIDIGQIHLLPGGLCFGQQALQLWQCQPGDGAHAIALRISLFHQLAAQLHQLHRVVEIQHPCDDGSREGSNGQASHHVRLDAFCLQQAGGRHTGNQHSCTATVDCSAVAESSSSGERPSTASASASTAWQAACCGNWCSMPGVWLP